MRIAVVGAGYAGLAAVWHFLQKKFDVTVFDGGEGASHVSTGLLHASPGRQAKPTWRAQEGIEAATELLEAASREKPVFIRNGILRMAIDEEQKKALGGDTLWIPEGITVFSKLYLEGLKKACGKAEFKTHWVQDLKELAAFDAVVLTTGAETLKWADLPLKKTIGQCLLCKWKKPVPMSLLSYGHITPTEDPEICLVGSTYERTDQPDPQKALELLDRAALFYPAAKEFKVLKICSGVRISAKMGYRPVVKQIGPKTWVFAGLGSRGLIYHALFAKEIASIFTPGK